MYLTLVRWVTHSVVASEPEARSNYALCAIFLMLSELLYYV